MPTPAIRPFGRIAHIGQTQIFAKSSNNEFRFLPKKNVMRESVRKSDGLWKMLNFQFHFQLKPRCHADRYVRSDIMPVRTTLLVSYECRRFAADLAGRINLLFFTRFLFVIRKAREQRPNWNISDVACTHSSLFVPKFVQSPQQLKRVWSKRKKLLLSHFAMPEPGSCPNV